MSIQSKLWFSSSQVWMWELDHKEGWALKNLCFWTVVLEKTLKGHLDHKEIRPVNPKGNQCWIFIERTDAEGEAPILWPPDVRGRLTGKDPDAVKIEGRRRWWWQRMRWFDNIIINSVTWVWANSGRQRSLVSCSPWGCRVGHDWVTKQQT